MDDAAQQRHNADVSNALCSKQSSDAQGRQREQAVESVQMPPNARAVQQQQSKRRLEAVVRWLVAGWCCCVSCCPAGCWLQAAGCLLLCCYLRTNEADISQIASSV